jgi:hypothetical protein
LMFKASVLLLEYWIYNTNICRTTAQVSHRGGPVLISGQVAWDFCWTVRYWSTFPSSEYLSLLLPVLILPIAPCS